MVAHTPPKALPERSNIFIDDTGELTPSELRYQARQFQQQHGEFALIMVGYLQLMRVP
ncbi:DnaB-like helicase C-terminal domain-containing protein [Citrobacter enshiensis]|uniref:DnaB-like helicase C-terminal domain-containing protein n=1 Tax=Citrobacter enshiensis TaxID=2971264 RepID=UPI00399D579A